MPSTRRESILFGTIFGIVFVMTFYNMWIDEMLGKVTFTELLLRFAIGFVIALSLDLFDIGPLAR